MPRGPNSRPGGSRGDILATFTRHVAEFGYDGTNFGAIAAELGLSKGTIVHHFRTKELLFAEAHETYMTGRMREAEAIVADLDSPDQQMAGLIAAFALYQTHGRTATVAFQREIVRFRASASMATSRKLRAKYLDLVVEILDDGMNRGLFRRGDSRLWALQIFGGTQWMWTWFKSDGRISNEEVARSCIDLALGGLLVDRYGLRRLMDPDGPVMQTVRTTLQALPEQSQPI